MIFDKIEYVCFLNGSGFSFAAQNYIDAIIKEGGYDVKINIFGQKPSRPSVSDKRYEYFMNLKNKPRDERIFIYHCIPNLQRRVPVGDRPSIGFGVFETFQPPEAWIDILNKNDAIITPSKFNYNIFSHSKIDKPIYYIPHSIDFSIYNEEVEPMFKYDKFTFLYMGTWKERKGYKQLIEAWFSEFSQKDNVQLVIKTDKPQQAILYINRIKMERGFKQGFAPIIVENKVFDEEDLPRFIKSAHCLISPTMGEGFGYPGLQCMALKIPVAITDFSGCQDYANENTAMLIKPSGFIFKNNMDGIPQFRNKKWAFIEVKTIKAVMRKVYEDKILAKEKSEYAYNFVKENFNYKVIEKKFTGMLREVYG